MRVQAAAVNPVDAFVRSGTYRHPRPMPPSPDGIWWARSQAPDPGHGDSRTGCGATAWAMRAYSARPRSSPQFPQNGCTGYRTDAPRNSRGRGTAEEATAYLDGSHTAACSQDDGIRRRRRRRTSGSAAIAMAAPAGARSSPAHTPTTTPDAAQRARGSTDYRDPHLPDRLTEHAPQGIEVYWETRHHDFAGGPGRRGRLPAPVTASGTGHPAGTTPHPLHPETSPCPVSSSAEPQRPTADAAI